MERSAIDPVRMLLGKAARGGCQRVQARDRDARFASLTGREALRANAASPRETAPREQVEGAVPRCEAGVVCGPFIGEMPASGQRIMDGEHLRVGEDRAQDRRRRRRLYRAVEHLLEVGRGEVNLPVGRVSRRRHGRGVRRPHRRRTARQTQEEPVVRRRGRGDHRLIGAGEADAPERGEARSIVRREDRLEHAEIVNEAHLREPLERCRSRVRRLPAVARARDVPRREPAIVVRGADETVELGFAHTPRLLLPHPIGEPRAWWPTLPGCRSLPRHTTSCTTTETLSPPPSASARHTRNRATALAGASLPASLTSVAIVSAAGK